MNRDDFESRVLELWMRTRIPLTRAHLQYDTGARRRELDRWLDEMVVDGILEMEVGDDGEVYWSVPGAARAAEGPRSFGELEGKKGRGASRRLRAGKGKGRGESGAEELVLANKALSLAGKAQSELKEQRGEGKKSLLISAGVSLLGPIGWLYAAPFRESIPAIAALSLLWYILPSFLLTPILFFALPLSSIAGLVYAWQYNRYGKRTPIFLSDGEDEDKKEE